MPQTAFVRNYWTQFEDLRRCPAKAIAEWT